MKAEELRALTLQERREYVWPHWIAALRSGRYKQGRVRLRDEYDRYCCLGVLCDLGTTPWTKSTDLMQLHYEFKGFTCLIEDGVAELAGLTATTKSTLMTMNDGSGASFNDIADWLQAELEEGRRRT